MSGASSYPHRSVISLRWKDNDVYGHVNNVEYYSFFDTVINEYLITAGLDIHTGEAIGLCAESHCAFKAAAAFPGRILAGLGVEHLGTSSVRYAVGLFDAAEDLDAARLLAEGWFVHVFVDRHERRATPIPDPIRASLEAIRR